MRYQGTKVADYWGEKLLATYEKIEGNYKRYMEGSTLEVG